MLDGYSMMGERPCDRRLVANLRKGSPAVSESQDSMIRGRGDHRIRCHERVKAKDELFRGRRKRRRRIITSCMRMGIESFKKHH